MITDFGVLYRRAKIKKRDLEEITNGVGMINSNPRISCQ